MQAEPLLGPLRLVEQSITKPSIPAEPAAIPKPGAPTAQGETQRPGRGIPPSKPSAKIAGSRPRALRHRRSAGGARRRGRGSLPKPALTAGPHCGRHGAPPRCRKEGRLWVHFRRLAGRRARRPRQQGAAASPASQTTIWLPVQTATWPSRALGAPRARAGRDSRPLAGVYAIGQWPGGAAAAPDQHFAADSAPRLSSTRRRTCRFRRWKSCACSPTSGRRQGVDPDRPARPARIP